MFESGTFTQYVQSLNAYPVLDESVVRELFAQYQKGDKAAKEKLINHNLKLVVKIARRYERQDEHRLMDLISEGNIGLMRAIDKFNLSEGTKFNTYAYRWIQFRIEQHFSGAIQAAYCPTHTRKLARKISRIESEIEKENFTGCLLNEIHTRLLNEGADVELDEVSRLRELNRSSLSIEYTKDEDSDVSLKHIISDGKNLEKAETVEDLARWVKVKMGCLPENQRKAVLSYFGSGNVDGQTMKMVGEEMGYTPQRAQQIVKDGLASLKKMALFDNIDLSMLS